MKKLLALILALILVIVVVAGCTGNKEPAPAPGVAPEGEEASKNEQTEDEVPGIAIPTPAADGEDQQTDANPEDGEALGLQAEKLYALHDPDEVVMTIDGQDVTWQDYFYFYYSQATQMDQQFQMYQAYGVATGWDSEADDEGHTYADLLGQYTEDTLRQLAAVESLAAENGVTLSEEDEAELQASHQELIQARFGEEGTEEQLYEFLESIYVSPELYQRLTRFPYLHENCFTQLYGENGEKLEEEEVLAWMEENGILSANHILIATVDPATGEALEESVLAEKTALAQQIAEELQAIQDPAEREARFLELKEQYCDDGGDYVFGPGAMVQEFYDGAMALEENQISDPIQSSYGYHIILRRPLHADDAIFNGSYSAPVNGRAAAANQLYNTLLEQRIAEEKVEYEKGFEVPNLMDYYVKPVYTE